MNTNHLRLLMAGMMFLCFASLKAENKVAVHGSVYFDGLVWQKDASIGATEDYNSPFLFNSYADVNLASKYVDAGVRFEFMRWPLPGFEPDFAGWGVPNIYVKGKFKGMELTLGDFYEQFGSGFILRTYEERTLGIDNSIRGARLKFNNIKGLRLTALGGIQRVYWDWKLQSQVYGFNADAYLEDWISGIADKNASLNIGASWTLKHEKDEDIIVPGTNYRLNLPKEVNAFDVRANFSKGPWNLTAEYAWKGQDPSFDNDYTYGSGNAVLLSGSLSKKGFSAMVQAKRSENMSYRSQRTRSGLAAFINYMPAFTYQHTYSLPALFPYATQYGPGEWAFQGQLAFSAPKKSTIGGKYGAKFTMNLSYIARLVHEGEPDYLLPGINSIEGTNGYKTSFFKIGEANYWDFNLQFEKKFSKVFDLQLMYMSLMYNRTAVEDASFVSNEESERIYSQILVADAKFKFNRKFTLRSELQYLFGSRKGPEAEHPTPEDIGYGTDWAYGLLEFSYSPYVMIFASDMWNCGGTGTHYYMFGITGNYKSNRLQLSYGRTRKGYNCSGGVCRLVPAMKGFQITYSYNF